MERDASAASAEPPHAEPANATTAIDKALDVLFALRDAPEPLGVTALGQTLGLPKSSVHRMLGALMRRRLVERDARGQYSLGVGLVALGLGALEREPWVAVARPFLEQLSKTLGETSFLIAAKAGELVVLDKVEGTGFLRAAPQVGTSVPVHATAAGKVYLAFDRDQLLPGAATAGLLRYTPNARDAATLAAELGCVRERGYAVSREEWIVGLSVLAAPVRGRTRLWGVVVTAMPTAQLQAHGEEAVAQHVCATVARIAGRLEGELE